MRKKLAYILITIGVLAWFPYIIGNYILGQDLPIYPFLTVHLLCIIPGAILKRLHKPKANR